MDIQNMLIWWAYLLVIGVIFLPVSSILFPRFFDKGYLFAKTLGVIFLSYLVWLFSSIKLLPFNRTTVLVVLAAAAIVVFVLTLSFYGRLKDKLPTLKHLKFFILEEIIFLAALAFWTFLRGLKPEIQGLEKFMDLGFVNAILRTPYMPPIDMWFAGKGINYYYFGHFVGAFLTRLTGIDAAITYNLMIATLASFTFSLCFSIILNLHYKYGKSLKKAVIAGLLAAFILTFAGNLHSFVYGYAKPYIAKNITHTELQRSYFYPDSTRYIGYNPDTDDKTIHEFPLYSFVVSDLHGHVSDIPYVLTFIALAWACILTEYKTKLLGVNRYTLLLALVLSVNFMTNAWDYPIYLTVLFAVFFYIRWVLVNLRIGTARKPKSSTTKRIRLKPSEPQIIETPPHIAALYAIGEVFKVFVVSQLLLLPFSLNFDSISSAVDLVKSRTPLYQLFMLWGHQFIFVLTFIVFLVWLIAKAFLQTDRTHADLVTTLRGFSPSDAFCFILSICAIGLVLLPEVVYVVDIYTKGYHRANTMFKLTYQAYILFGLVIGYIILRVIPALKNKTLKALLIVLFAVSYILPMTYAGLSIPGYYGNIKPTHYKGLYGLYFMKHSYPDDYAAVKWFNENIKGQPTILEAHGESYSNQCRISMATGLPTIQGWTVHEWLWRGSYEAANNRALEVTAVYESDDLEKTWEILRRYKVEYIVIGNLDREKFPNINMDKLMGLGSVAFQSGSTMVIKVYGSGQ